MLEIIIFFLLEAFSYLLMELSVRSLISPFQRDRKDRPLVSLAAYAFWGIISGIISLPLLPYRIAQPLQVWILILLVAPICIGLLMSAFGKIIVRRGGRPIQLDQFGCGYVFALGMALIRFFFCWPSKS